MEFSPSGNPQPPGIINIHLSKFKDTFTRIEDTVIRNDIYEKWELHYSDLKKSATSEITQWIGGSFTTLKEKPSDIDFATFLPYTFVPINSYLFSSEEIENDSRTHYGVDSYPIVVYPESDPRFTLTQKATKYWSTWFGKTRKDEKRAVLEVIV